MVLSMNHSDFDKKISLIEERIGYVFNDKSLISKAFVHKSFVNEDPNVHESLERLEFFGDALLNVFMSEHLMALYKDESEGDLSRRRARLIDTNALNVYLDKFSILEFLRTSKGVPISAKMKADLFEAVLGAIYFDAGFDRTKEWLFFNILDVIHSIDASKECDYKGSLQDHLQKQYHKKPDYKLLETHEEGFLMGVYFDNALLATGSGISKKEAEVQAAKKALEGIDGKKG